MINIKGFVQKDKVRSDGSYMGYILISQNRETKRISTGLIFSKSEISSTFKIKPCRTSELLDSIVRKYRERVNQLEAKGLTRFMTLNDIVTYITNIDRDIDILEEIRLCSESIPNYNTATGYKTVYCRLSEYVGRKSLNINEVTVNFLINFENFLRARNVNPNTLRNYMSSFQAVFNRCILKYNDEEKGLEIIKSNPFLRYKKPAALSTKKKALEPVILRMIKMIPDDTLFIDNPNRSLINFIRDMFLLSFYLRGTNAIDFMNMKPSDLKGDRLEFNRTKTMNRRSDAAFVSMKVEPEAMSLIERYRGKDGYLLCIGNRYSSQSSFRTAIRMGIIQLRNYLGLNELTFYSARHSWATIARNNIGASVDDVAMGLNHASRRVTDVYIMPDWSRIDKLNRDVIDFTFYK